MLQDNLISLSKLFTERLFRIPDYQRGYAWTTHQLQDFWNDLELLEPGRSHYTGVITLEPVPRSIYSRWADDLWLIDARSYQPFFVVDGQQRLITSLTLIQCILEKAGSARLNYSTREDIIRRFIHEKKNEGISSSFLFGFPHDSPSNEFLKTRIFNTSSEVHGTCEQSIYTRRLLGAKQYLLSQLEGMDIPALERVFTAVTQRLLFNTHIIAKEIDTFVAFETMNNRGRPLSTLELLKNRLIYLSTRIKATQDQRDRVRRVVNEAWKTVYHFLGRNEEQPLSDDLFLSHYAAKHWSAHFIRDGRPPRYFGRSGELRQFILGSVFTARNLPGYPNPVEGQPTVTAKQIRGFALDIKSFVALYFRLRNPNAEESYSSAIRVALTRLARLNRLDDMNLVAAMAEATSEGRYFLKFLTELERLRFAQAVWRDPDMYEPENVSSALAARVRQGDLTAKQLCDRLAERTLSFAGKYKSYAPLWRARDRRFYDWRALRHFFYEYELHLKKQTKGGLSKLDWQEFVRDDYMTAGATIEHVMPQRATNAYWQATLKDIPRYQRHALRHSLGNLLAVSRRRNSAFGNQGFDKKKERVGTTLGYSYGSYSEIEVSKVSDWGPGEILERGLRLLSFMEERWGVVLGDRSRKAEFLGLDFLL